MQGEMVVAVASPSSAPPSAGRLHPTYKEMILQALTELRDPSGSSRSAIANYIADHFSGLHSRHDALLSVHLRSLKSHGQLRLVSGNYFVSSSPPKAAPGQKRCRGRPRKNPDLAPPASIPAFQGPKRGRGRPRKNALVPVASSPSPPLQGASAPPPPSGVKRGRGRPRKDALVLPPPSSSPLLGAIDPPPPPSGVKRGRGRPRKNAHVRSSLSHLLGAIASPPPPSGVKRSRGRPRKNAPVRSSFSSQVLGAIAPPPPPSGVKRSRGRPRKKAPVRSSSSQLLGAIAPPPPSGVKRGRGRPRKDAYPAVAPLLGGEQGPAGGQPQRNTIPLSQPPATVSHSGKSRPFRLLRVAVDISALRGSSMGVSACSNSTVVDAKRGRGRPPKAVVAGKEKDKMQPESVQSADASLTKRGRGRPRKEKALENGHLKAPQMAEGQHEALTAQAADQAGAVQNEVEARDLSSSLTEKKMTEGQQEDLTAQAADQAGAVQSEVEARDLQSLGTPLTEKRGRGRPKKRQLETKTAEAGVDASAVKRGRGRPRKEKTLETGDLKVAQMTEGTHEALPAQAEDQTGPMQNEVEARILQSLGTPLMEKRGRGRPRKRPLETETAETQVDALVKKRGRGRPRKARPFETESVETAVEVSRDLTEDGPEKDGDLVPGQKAETQDAGGVLLSEEEAAIAPMDAGGATPRVDPMDVGTKSH